jgi:hypothetical protein
MAVVLAALVGLPFLLLSYQAKRSGLSRGEVVQRIFGSSGQESGQQQGQAVMGEKIDFLDRTPIGDAFTEPPLIAHIQAVDLDDDGLLDVVLCDDRGNFVSWIRQFPAGTYTETVLAGDLVAPAHVQAIDFDFDGDKDLMVGVLGMLFPNNDKIGSVVILENEGPYQFRKHVVAEKIARVSDVRAGDLDGDGDMDLAVAQFGYDDGETRWIENLGNWEFRSHILQYLSGPVNVEITDIDFDGDLDIISLVSQEWEEIYCFVNDGMGKFQPHLLYGSSNQDYGSSGIALCDLDRDGDQDILYTNGDAFDYIPPQGRPWHGVQWLENKGKLEFEYHRIGDFPGAYAANAADVDRDGDLDVIAVSCFNDWEKGDAASMMWFENDGHMSFVPHPLASDPTHLLVLESGDMDGDGWVDFVSGGFYAYPPYDRMGRVVLWKNVWPLRATRAKQTTASGRDPSPLGEEKR